MNYKFNSDLQPYEFSEDLPVSLSIGLNRYANIITDVRDERVNPDGGNDGYWIYLTDGFIDPNAEMHFVHEYTIFDVLNAMHNVTRCTPQNCASEDDHRITDQFTGNSISSAKSAIEAMIASSEEKSVESPLQPATASELAYCDVTGYSLFRRLDLGHTVELRGCTYDVMSVQYDYDYSLCSSGGNPIELVWAIELRIVVSDSVNRSMLQLPYLYLKANDNDPSWAFIDQLIPILGGNENGYLDDDPSPSPEEIQPDLNSASEEPSDNSKIDVPILTIRHDNRVPVTVVSPNRSTNRVVAYYSANSIRILKRKSSSTQQVGSLTIDKIKRTVTRRMLTSGLWSQWEVLQLYRVILSYGLYLIIAVHYHRQRMQT